MKDKFENNDLLVNNFQDDIKKSQENFNQESIPNTEEENELDEDIFQYTANIREIAINDFSKYINKESTQNNTNKNEFINNLNFKYSNDANLNEDISGISLLKELEEQWNNIEKQKNNNLISKVNKNDESTYSNSKSNNNFDKFKYIIDMVELKKNKFISMREKAKKERNEDQEIEQYFLEKLKEMDKYIITNEDLLKKIEIRKQEKSEDNNYEEQNEENNDLNANNDNDNYNNGNENFNSDNDLNNQYYINNNYINENTFNKRQYLNNFQNQNKTPELEDLIYETPARINNFGNINNNIKDLEKNNNKNDYEIENEDNVNMGNISRPEKNIMSGKLFDKMKNLYKEINGDNNNDYSNKLELLINNKSKIKNNSHESGVLGINNINIKDNKFEENIILKNIIDNNNNNDNINVKDANKSISLNFNFINKNHNYANRNAPKNEKNNYTNNMIFNPDDRKIQPKQNSIFKDKNRLTLSGLQENFDDILKNVRSNNRNKDKTNVNLYNNDEIEEKEEMNKYFEELTNEAKSNLKKNKNISKDSIKNQFKNENKILKKIEENSLYLNDFMNETNQNKNKFKQRMIDLTNNLNNLGNIDIINESYKNKQIIGYSYLNNININQKNLKEPDIFSNNNFNNY